MVLWGGDGEAVRSARGSTYKLFSLLFHKDKTPSQQSIRELKQPLYDRSSCHHPKMNMSDV